MSMMTEFEKWNKLIDDNKDEIIETMRSVERNCIYNSGIVETIYMTPEGHLYTTYDVSTSTMPYDYWKGIDKKIWQAKSFDITDIINNDYLSEDNKIYDDDGEIIQENLDKFINWYLYEEEYDAFSPESRWDDENFGVKKEILYNMDIIKFNE